MTHQDWTFENVPQSFWDRIEAAHGDGVAFRQSLASLSREQMKEMWLQYNGLVDQLFTDDHLQVLGHGIGSDDAIDIATGVVMQGRERYLHVRDHPQDTPRKSGLRGPSFASLIAIEYRQRFGVAVSAP